MKASFNNEEVLGKGLKRFSLPREDFFITTKLNTFEGFGVADWTHTEIEKLKNGLLFLIYIELSVSLS